MNANDLVKEITTYCITNANSENALKYSRFFKDGYNGYGLTSPQMYSIVKQLLNTKTIMLPMLLDTSQKLVYAEKSEETSIFLLLLDGLHKQFTKDTLGEIEAWFNGSIHNWAHADTLGMFILPKFILKGIVDIHAFEPWLGSPYKFQRRCVPVTLIKILKNNKAADFTPYFSFIEPLVTDKEREVHQGVGWFLREAWKIQPAATETFLLKWKDVAPRLIIQYATEKMTKENKDRFKRTK